MTLGRALAEASGASAPAAARARAAGERARLIATAAA